MATEWVAVVSLKMYSARPWLQFAPARMMVFYQSRWLAGVSPCQTREHGQREHSPGPEAETVYRAPQRGRTEALVWALSGTVVAGGRFRATKGGYGEYVCVCAYVCVYVCVCFSFLDERCGVPAPQRMQFELRPRMCNTCNSWPLRPRMCNACNLKPLRPTFT